MALWFSLFCGNAIFAMAQDRIMRVEESRKQVLIGHSGNLADVSSHMQDEHGPKESATKLVDELLELAPAFKAQAKAATENEHLCNKNYIPGTLSAKDCPSGLGNIHTQTMCTDAGRSMGLARGGDALNPFKIPDEQFNAFPKGCFMKTGDMTALWFNAGDNPTDATLTGTAVCQRPKYKISAAADCTAETGYEAILDEEKCRSFALCIDKYCASSKEFFQVGVPAVSPADDYRPVDQRGNFFDQRPEGCFVHPGPDVALAGCVFFNVPRAGVKPSGTISGTSACMASSGHHSTNTTSTAATVTAAPTR